jgi:hypothetical protein
MNDRIRDRAYWLWRYKEAIGVPSTPEQNWHEAQAIEEALAEHAQMFHKFDIDY